jgi:hypothetical protein
MALTKIPEEMIDASAGSADEVLTTDGTDATWAAAAGGGGITQADSWELTTSFTGGAAPIATNLAQASGTGFETLGDGMSQSAGIFTFPSTGYWAVLALFNFRKEGDSAYNQAKIMVAVDAGDGDTYSAVVIGETSMTQHDSANMRTSCVCYALVDVTSVTTVKVRFDVASAGSATLVFGAAAGYYSTSFHFLRLGDT